MALGEEAAFREIVRYYHKQLLPVSISLLKSEQEARDVMQEVFLKLWMNRAELASVDNPGGWLRTVIAHTTSNRIRSQLRYELRNKKLIADTPEALHNMQDLLDAKFAQSRIEEAVMRMPAKRKEVFLLSRREGLSRREIAARLNISENTVRNHLAEGITFVQDYLREKGLWMIPSLIILLSDIK